MRVNILKAQRNAETWANLIHKLIDAGYEIHCESPVEPADLTIVLGGQFENVGILTGHKCLVFHRHEWQPLKEGFGFFRRLLQEYYDDFVDVTSTSMGEALKKIEDYIADFGRKIKEL